LKKHYFYSPRLYSYFDNNPFKVVFQDVGFLTIDFSHGKSHLSLSAPLKEKIRKKNEKRKISFFFQNLYDED